MTDIERQKRAEDALAASERRWNHALESAGQGVWDHDLRRGGDVFYSRMWRIMRGFAPDEEVDGALDAWLERVHPDDRERLRETVAKQNAGEIPRNAFEYRERHRDGHYSGSCRAAVPSNGTRTACRRVSWAPTPTSRR